MNTERRQDTQSEVFKERVDKRAYFARLGQEVSHDLDVAAHLEAEKDEIKLGQEAIKLINILESPLASVRANDLIGIRKSRGGKYNRELTPEEYQMELEDLAARYPASKKPTDATGGKSGWRGQRTPFDWETPEGKKKIEEEIARKKLTEHAEQATTEKTEKDIEPSAPGTRLKTSLEIALERLAKEEKTEKQKESPTKTVVDRLHVNGRDVRSELQETIKRSFDLEHESKAVREATERLEKVNKEREERLKQEANPRPKPAVAETPNPAVVVAPTPETIRTQKEGPFVHASMGYWEKINGKDTYVNKTYKQPLGESGESKLEQAVPATTPEPTPASLPKQEVIPAKPEKPVEEKPAPAKIEVPAEQPKKDASSPSKSPEDKTTEEARIERRREKNRRKRARRKAKRAEARKAQEDRKPAQVPAAKPPVERLTPKDNGKDGEPKNKPEIKNKDDGKGKEKPEQKPEEKPESKDDEEIRRVREQKIYRQGLERGKAEGDNALWREITRPKTIWERIRTPFKRKSKAKTELEAYEIDEARKMAAIYVLGGVGFAVAALGILQNYGIMLPVPINHLPLGWNPKGGFIPNK